MAVGRRASLWGDPVAKWTLSSEVSQMSVSVGLSSGAVHILQKVLQSPARGTPGCHSPESRVEVGDSAGGLMFRMHTFP